MHGCKAHQAELRGALQREDDCQGPRKDIDIDINHDQLLSSLIMQLWVCASQLRTVQGCIFISPSPDFEIRGGAGLILQFNCFLDFFFLGGGYSRLVQAVDFH